MLHLKHLFLASSIMLVGSFLPVIVPSSVNEVYAAIPLEKDPNGFCDLFWGETIKEVQGEYKMRFVEYKDGQARYAIVMPDAQSPLFADKFKVAFLTFRAGKLVTVVVASTQPASTMSRILTQLYGKPDITRGHDNLWLGSKTGILVNEYTSGTTGLKCQIIMSDANTIPGGKV